MDYLTKPTSRKELRKMARKLRQFCGVSQKGPFPVLLILDKVQDLFFGCDYIILSDTEFPSKTMARCVENLRGGYSIEIRESIYTAAYNGQGAALGFICHELCHLFLFKEGYTPIFERSFKNYSLRPYESVEWQTKCLCGEVMIPYKESCNMSFQEIIDKYHVSRQYACSRVKMDR